MKLIMWLGLLVSIPCMAIESLDDTAMAEVAVVSDVEKFYDDQDELTTLIEKHDIDQEYFLRVVDRRIDQRQSLGRSSQQLETAPFVSQVNGVEFIEFRITEDGKVVNSGIRLENPASLVDAINDRIATQIR